MKDFVYIDNGDITDPAVNLAIEEYILRHMDTERDYLLFYRNTPSLIVGRNQNILEEINDSYVRQNRIPVIRRLSGGGTVYHDLGNLNFSFVTRYDSSRLHNFEFFNKPVIRVLQSLGVPAAMNDRNDILVNGYKISGSAQFSSKGRMFSHGTLLFNTRLDRVDKALSVKTNGIQSKSHKSVRSEVANISDFLREPMDLPAFWKRLLTGFEENDITLRHHQLTDAERNAICQIRDKRYANWEWNTGRSPRFNITRTQHFGTSEVSVDIRVEKGYITQIRLHGNPEPPDRLVSLCRALDGVRYEPDDIYDVVIKGSGKPDETATPEACMELLYGRAP